MRYAIISTLLLAALGTLGDFVWAELRLPHRMGAGLAHGALLSLAMGGALGLPVCRIAVGAAAGVGIGLLAALLFYALAPVLGLAAMFAAWLVLWILFSLAHTHLLRREPWWGDALVRGLIAAAASGAAFYLVSGMWTRWDPATIDYVNHFWRWTLAFLPGFVALQAFHPAPLRLR